MDIPPGLAGLGFMDPNRTDPSDTRDPSKVAYIGEFLTAPLAFFCLINPLQSDSRMSARVLSSNPS